MVIRKMALVLSALALAGCKLETQATVFLADIADAVAGKAGKSEARLSLPMPSDEKCKEYAPPIIEALRPTFGEIRSPQCRKDGFETKLDLSFDLAIITEPADHADLPVISVVVLSREKENSIGLWVNRDKVAATQAAVAAKLRGAPKADLKTMIVQINISNDLRDTAALSVGSVFADGEPIPFKRTIEIKRREELKLRLSDVGVAAMLSGGAVGFATQPKAP